MKDSSRGNYTDIDGTTHSRSRWTYYMDCEVWTDHLEFSGTSRNAHETSKPVSCLFCLANLNDSQAI